jgi:ribonuclease BN (tRNA processing enzyme)
MRLELLGVGEAFDPSQPNSAALIEHDGFTLMIDCGHSVVPRLWRTRTDPDAVDAIYFTHHHADHVLGLPPVVNLWHYEERKKELLILTTPAGIEQLQLLIALMRVEPPYPIRYAVAAEAPSVGPFAIRLALTQHAAPNHAIRLEAGGRRLAWSGDGRPTAEALALYADADLLMQECFEPAAAPENRYHCDLPTARAIAGPSRIGLYHIRAGARCEMKAAIAGDERLFVPEAGDVIEV